MGKKEISSKLAAIAKQNFKEGEYWLKKLAGDLIKNSIPGDYSELGITERALDTVETFITGNLFSRLMKLSKKNDYSLHIILTAALVVLIYKYTGSQDITVGTPIYKQDVEGEFINTILVLRNQFTGNTTFRELLLQVRQTVAEATENQDYPMEILLEQLNMQISEKDFPLFDIAIVLENSHDKKYIKHINTNITLSFLKTDKSINGMVEYNASLYEKRTIEWMVKHFAELLEQAILHIDLELSRLDILLPDEKQFLLYDINDTRTDYPKKKTIVKIFEEQVEKTPDNIALVYEDRKLSYRELNRKSNQLALYLRRKGVGGNCIVGLMVERSIHIIIGILGILKVSGAYLPIDPGTPQRRIFSMLEDCGVILLLTDINTVKKFSFTALQSRKSLKSTFHITTSRAQIRDLDSLPLIDRSLIDYENYHKYIGQAMVKHSISFQATRGCPFQCAYCFKIWPNKHVFRSAENIIAEVQLYYNMGVRRFVFIDDIFNCNRKNSEKFFELIIKNKLDVQLIFPSGFRGDILARDYIDLLIEAGTVSFAMALETASPRLQKLVRKNLNLEKFRETIQYICEKYPNIVLELQTMHGLPTETEEEAMMTLDFIKSIKWIDFPYVNILKIFPNTAMEKIAIENGISREAIARSVELAYHQLPETLPFDKTFTLKYQSDFLNEYFLLKERLLDVLPHQMKVLTEDEMVQKYNSYLPVEINSITDLLEFVKIDKKELDVGGSLEEKGVAVPDLNRKIKEHFPAASPQEDALKVILLDISLFFRGSVDMLYDVVEPPLGLMYLMTYLKRQFGRKINGKIAKSRIDFDNYAELKTLLDDFKPDVIGIRSLTFYNDFFHTIASLIRQWGIDVPIIAGGPYATSNYATLLKDRNIDLVVLGEGEVTFAEIIDAIMANRGKLPDENRLKEIASIAFIPGREDPSREFCREVILMDALMEALDEDHGNDLPVVNQPDDLAYTIFTSGSTGMPKGTFTTHSNVIRVVKDTNYIELTCNDRILQLSNYAFDGSVFDIYGALLNGAALVMIRNEDVLALDRLADLLKKEKISVFFVTTALFNALVDIKIESFNDIRKVLFGGERVSVEHTRKALKHLGKDKIIHVYGPTETTVYATYYLVNEIIERQITIPIGKPIANTTIYILDSNLMPVPVGGMGQICIGGDGVAIGYLNDQALTSEKYISNPFYEGERLYSTGDLGRWLADGNIEFLGRIDQQVKIRGYRIELGEIERQFLNYVGVKEAVITVISKSATGNKTTDLLLCAYIVSEREFNPSELREFLSWELPDYMIPTYFIRVEKIPVTPNGKINKKALPKPEFGAAVGDDGTPKNEVEEKLAEIWEAVLGIEKQVIGVDVDFFELGGHSLKATILASQIQKELNVKVPLAQIFMTPTIKELAQYIRETTQNQYVAIEAAEKMDYYALSPAQKRLYVLHQMDSAMTNYNIPKNLVLEGNFDRKRMESTFRKMIKRHESLRTSFEMLKNMPVQRIYDVMEFEIEYYELRPEFSLVIDDIVKEFVRPFDLSQAPLLRVGVIKVEVKKHILMVDMHHIITDGTSMGIFVKEFMALYENRELPELRLHYKDFSLWQNNRIQSEEIEKQKFWQKEFDDEIPVLSLPYDYPRPAIQSFEGDGGGFKLDRETSLALKELIKQQDVTLFMALLAIYNVLLSKLSGQEDIIVGIPIAGRRHADLQPIIGMFVNTLALRNYPIGEKTFVVFLKEIKEKTLKAFENQDYQFEDLVEHVTINRDVGRNPLFDVMLTLQNIDIPEIEIPQLKLVPYTYKNKISKFDLTLHVFEGVEYLLLTFEYCTKLFQKTGIEKFVQYLRNIISTVLQSPMKEISKIEIMSKKEKKKVLFDFNKRGAQYTTRETLYELFKVQVSKTPDNTAVVFDDKQLSYRELNQRAHRLGMLLRDKGIKHETMAGIMVERSTEMIVGILGILGSGGAYLPIDPKQPKDRIKYMLEDSGVTVLLIQSHLENIVEFQSELIYLDKPDSYPSRASGSDNCWDVNEGDMAYVIYTSGSTGRPKGVIVEHRSIVNTLAWRKRYYQFNQDDAILQLPSLSFDSSVEDIFTPLISGARIVLIQEEKRYHLGYLGEITKKNKITHILVVPGLYNAFLQEIPESLTLVKSTTIAGDSFTEELIKNHYEKLNHVKLYNEYGPTENSVCTTVYEFNQGETKILIGKPIDNVGCYILNQYGRVNPVGIAGQLCVFGEGLARCYLNRPELTTENLVPNPYISGKMMYKTGDLARWIHDGNIEFLGRIDYQIKIRGYRIEPGEIEDRLLRHKQIKEAVVVVKESSVRNLEEGEKGDKYLCAYIVCYPSGTDVSFDQSKFRDYLSKHLPAYMIPMYFVQLETMPLTPNGKLDRKRLPEPEKEKVGDFTAPENRVEEKLVELWAEVLAIEKSLIGVHDNFFELGGHSLKAIMLISKIHKAFNKRVPLSVVFINPTIKVLAQSIQGATEERYTSIEIAEEKEYYPLSSSQKRFFVLQESRENNITYNLPIILEVEGKLDKNRLEETLKELIDRHESVRTSFEMIELELAQRIHDKVDFKITYHDLDKGDRSKEPGIEVREIIKKFIRPFDLSKPPLMRVGLIRLFKEKLILMVDMHHIMADQISMEIFMKDFISLYSGKELPPLRLHYKHYSEWQNRMKECGHLRKQEAYWLQQFEGKIPLLNMQTDYNRPSIQSFEGSRVRFSLEKEKVKALRECIVKEDATLYMIFLATFNVLLAKLCAQEDIIIGTPVGGRRHADLEQIVGPFVNTLALRNYPTEEKTFKKFFREVKEKVLAAFENQDYPFDDLVKQVGQNKDTRRNPLFDVMFSFFNKEKNSTEQMESNLEFKLRPHQYEYNVAHLDLMLIVTEYENSIALILEFDTSLFKCSTIHEIKNHCLEIIDQVLENKEIKIKEITLPHDLVAIKPDQLLEDEKDFGFS